MANKGQKFKKYDLDFKLKVLKEYENGLSTNSLATKYSMSRDTIFTWIRIKKKYGALEVAKRGRSKGEQRRDYKERYEILKKFQDFLVSKEQGKK